jgi:hypothetical protein
MAESDPLSQIFTLFAAPLAGAVQSFDQFRSGVDQFQRGVENFNRTMENLNETAERINRLLAEVEEPLRVAVPQFTRSVKAADDMMKVVAGPAMAVAPGLQALADTLNNPSSRQIPHQLAQMNDVLAEITARLAPLGNLAESAGGLFGGLRFPGVSGSSKPARGVSEPDPPTTSRTLAATQTTVTKRTITSKPRTASKKSASKKSATKSPSKKSASTKSPSKKSATTKTSATSTAAARKSATKKSAAKES